MMKKMNIVPYGFPCKLDEAPCGLFLGGDDFDVLCFKTEYSTNGKSDCYIDESGETYCGQRDKVQPCIVESLDEED